MPHTTRRASRCWRCRRPYDRERRHYADVRHGRIAPICGPCLRETQGPQTPHNHVQLTTASICPVCGETIPAWGTSGLSADDLY